MTFFSSRLIQTCLCACLLLANLPAKAAEVPEPQSPLLTEAQRSLSRSRFDKALEQANSFLAQNPKDIQGRFIKAMALSQLGQTDEAIALYTQIIEEAPETPEPYNNLAVLHAQRGQFDQARQALEMAILVNPDYAMAHENLGDVYARLSVEQYRKAQLPSVRNNALDKKLKTLGEIVTTMPDQTAPRPIPATRKTSTLPF